MALQDWLWGWRRRRWVEQGRSRCRADRGTWLVSADVHEVDGSRWRLQAFSRRQQAQVSQCCQRNTSRNTRRQVATHFLCRVIFNELLNLTSASPSISSTNQWLNICYFPNIQAKIISSGGIVLYIESEVSESECRDAPDTNTSSLTIFTSK